MCYMYRGVYGEYVRIDGMYDYYESGVLGMHYMYDPRRGSYYM